jgi:hypothetical protein
MLRKISFLSLGSMAMVFCFLVSVSVMASNKSTKHKINIKEAESGVSQSSVIAELYMNLSYAYFPISNLASIEAIKLSETNPEYLSKKDEKKVLVTKDDYHYYFKKDKHSFTFLYAIKDNNIPLYDGFEYENEIKIAVGNQIFSFNMMNGRPVGLMQSAQ